MAQPILTARNVSVKSIERQRGGHYVIGAERILLYESIRRHSAR